MTKIIVKLLDFNNKIFIDMRNKEVSYKNSTLSYEEQYKNYILDHNSKQQNAIQTTNKRVQEIKKKYSSKKFCNSMGDKSAGEKENRKCSKIQQQQYSFNYLPTASLSSTQRHLAQPTPRLGGIDVNQEKLISRMKQMKQLLHSNSYKYDSKLKKQSSSFVQTQRMSNKEDKIKRQSYQSHTASIFQPRIDNISNITNKIKTMLHNNYVKQNKRQYEKEFSHKEFFSKNIALQNSQKQKNSFVKEQTYQTKQNTAKILNSASSMKIQRPLSQAKQFILKQQKVSRQRYMNNDSPYISPQFRNINEHITQDISNRKVINVQGQLKSNNSLQKTRDKAESKQQNFNINNHKMNYTERDKGHQQDWQRKSKQQSKSLDGEKVRKQGRNVQEEIKNIQNKIRLFEEEKRKLNIYHKPYDYNKASKFSNITQKPSNNNDSSFKSEQDNKQRKIIQNNYEKNRYSALKDRPPLPKDKINKIEQNSSQSKNKSEFKIKLIPIQNDTQQQANYSKIATQKFDRPKYLKNNMINTDYQKTDKRINQHNKSCNTLKKMIEKLSEQVLLDEKVRNAKIWLRAQQQEDKWERLYKELKYNSLSISTAQLKKMFTASECQNNPFYSVCEENQTYQSIAQDYAKAEKHWQRQVLRKFPQSQFSYNSFFVQKIDLEGKGHFVLEDLVRLLNMETSVFYRNRDLFLIFRRIIKEGTKGSYDEIIKILCH